MIYTTLLPNKHIWLKYVTNSDPLWMANDSRYFFEKLPLHKRSTLILFLTLSLALFTTACQSLPGFNIFSGEPGSDEARPVSNFVDPRQSIQVGVGEPLAIASYHRGYTKLSALQISVNGQPVRSEATAGQPTTFPDTLAAAQVLVWGQPAQASLEQVSFPSPTCQYLGQAGGPVQANPLPLAPPSSVWTVCHIWTGHIPGTYDLSLVAVDDAQRAGEPIVQRIEVR